MVNFLKDHMVAVSAGAVLLLAGAAVTAYDVGLHSTERTVTVTITKTWTQYSDNHTINLIGTSGGVFEDEDSLFYGKFNSSDYFNNMKVGQTYTFDVTGWRIPILSAYPNVVSCEDC